MPEPDILTQIDDATTAVCHQCTRLLGDSVSEWWCSPDCQRAWTEHQVDVERLTRYLDPWDSGFRPTEPFWRDPSEGLLPAIEDSDENYGRPLPRGAQPGFDFEGIGEFFATMQRAAEAMSRQFAAMLEGMAAFGEAFARAGQVTFVEIDAVPSYQHRSMTFPTGGVLIGPAERAVDGAAVLTMAAAQAREPVEPRIVLRDRSALTGPAPGWGPPLHADDRRNRRVH